MANTMTTWWGCAVCKVKGEFETEPHFDAWSGVLQVQDEHVKASPECPERYYIRVSIRGPIPNELMVLPMEAV